MHRENTNHWKSKTINSTLQRAGGYCPLTPKEVGIFLRALGYPPSTWVYIAAGEIFGGDTYLSDLRARFPNLIFKVMSIVLLAPLICLLELNHVEVVLLIVVLLQDTLTRKEELKEFASHATQTAALDYIISVESDVFVPSFTGNMARSVEGHRRFLGHRKTINPDR